MTYFERHAQIISKFWTKIAHNLIGSLDNINSNLITLTAFLNIAPTL